MISLQLLLLAVVACYVGLLLLLNAVPSLKVKSIGWLTLYKVVISLPNTAITADKIQLRLTPTWSASLPFRMVVLHFHNLVVTRTTTDEEIKRRSGQRGFQDAPDDLHFQVTSWIYLWLFRRGWINQMLVHLYHFSFFHHALDDVVSFHLDYTKLENFHDLANAKNKLTLSALDGYIRNGSAENELSNMRFFHNFELALDCDVVFSCKSARHMDLCLSNFGVLLILGDLHIRDIPYLMAMRKRKVERKNKILGDQPKITSLPSVETILHKLNLVSSVQLKLEQSIVEFKEVKLASSSYSFNYTRDCSYKQQTLATFSSYATAAKFYHLDLKCVDIPQLTHLLEANLTDVYRAFRENDLQNYFVDLSTTLNLSNPAVNIFFDQFSYLLSAFGGRDLETPEKKPLSFRRFYPYLRRLRKVSARIAIMDTKATLHIPAIDSQEFHRRSLSNVITNAEVQHLGFKTSSKDLGTLIERNCKLSKPLTLKGYAKIKNLNLEVEENKFHLSSLTTLIGYCVNSNHVALRVVLKRLHLKSVNTMIFHVLRKIREAEINHYNKACAGLRRLRSKKQSVSKDQSKEDQLKELFIDIFDILPPAICSIRLRASFVLTYIICNDYLPSQKIFDEILEEDIDLASFKRGLSLKFDELDVNYKRDQKLFDASLKQIEAHTLSDYGTEHLKTLDTTSEFRVGEVDFDDASSIDSGLSASSTINSNSDVRPVKQVLQVQDIIVSNSMSAQDKLHVSIPEVSGRIDIFLVWCIMYAHALIEMISPEIEKTYSSEQVRELNGVSKKLKLDVEIASLCLVARIPHDVDVLFEIDSMVLRNVFVEPRCQIEYCRLYVVHPATKLWTRFVSISDTYVNLENVTKTSFALRSRAVRISIPFQFLVYTVIDNIITFVKAARQIRHNFSHLSQNIHDYSKILPEAKEAVEVPLINWKANVFGLTLENDAFEAQLGLIYELGMVEQIERKRKEMFFENKAAEIRKAAKDLLSGTNPKSNQFVHANSHNQKHKMKKFGTALFAGQAHTEKHPSANASNCAITSSLSKVFNADKRSEKDSQSENSKPADETKSGSDDLHDDFIMTEDRAEEIIAHAREALNREYATSWINKFKSFKRSKIKLHGERVKEIWGNDSVNKLVREKYDIQDYAHGPPQLYGVFKDFDLTIDDPEIPDIHEFLHTYGKGQPKLIYSILVPVFLHLRSSAVCFGIRDYILPLISFPANETTATPVMDFLGTLVINEKLVGREEELRQIFVPFSPATAKAKVSDNFYSVDVVRTLTPVKMMFDFTCNLVTDKACIISWCKAYQPALLGIMASLDNITKPEIDDSPLGWWDKLALNAHGKMRFNIENELCLHIKSSQSPYSLIGESSGFAFCWKHNVLLRINDTGLPSEMVILESDDFMLAIPNYSTTERKTWSLLYHDGHDQNSDVDVESKKFQKTVMKLTSDEKVTWKVGFLFERNVDVKATEISNNMERTDDFKPHYDVVVTGPQYEYHPDSFEKFRSDYLHLAISVNSTSKKGNSHNSAYLTPLTFKYFFVWWNTLNETISLPIREGMLFREHSKKSSLVKFGSHLVTFKYQLVLEPLTISHLYIASGGADTGYRVISTGMKGKFKKCIIDLHQRREVARYVNEKLGINKKVRKLKLNMGEIDVTDADIRLLHAQFDDISLKGKLFAFYTGQSQEMVDAHTHQQDVKERNRRRRNTDWIRGLSVTNDDFLWLDLDDFVELEDKEILSADPQISIIPFFFTPKFTFFREFTLEHPEGKFPYGKEKSHQCLIGSQSPDKVQAELINDRFNEVKSQVEENVTILNNLEEVGGSDQKYKKIKLMIAKGEERMEKILTIYEGITGLSQPPSVQELSPSVSRYSSPQTDLDLLRTDSKALSLISNYRSLEQARQVTTANAGVSEFHNRFLIHNLKMTWNNKVRDTFTNYLSLVGDKKTESLSMTRKAVDLVENILMNVDKDVESTKEELKKDLTQKFSCGGDVIQGFEEYLNNVDSDEHEVEFKFLVKLIRPQIQLTSDADPNSCMLLTAQDIELRQLGVNLEGTNDIIADDEQETALVETRFGVLFQDAHVFAFNKKDFPEISSDPYGLPGQRKLWPPWVDIEVCDDSSFHEDNLVFEKITMALSLIKPNMLSIDSSKSQDRHSEIVLHLAKAVINATSTQYSAIYFIVTDLLMQSTTVTNSFRKRIENVTAVSDVSDFIGLAAKVSLLQSNIRIARHVLLKMDESSVHLSAQEKKNKVTVETEMERMKIELSIIIKGLELVGSKNSINMAAARNWSIHADQVILHLLDDDREPLADFALATSKFHRVDANDGSNSNIVDISMIQGFNLRKGAAYPELLGPFLGVKKDKIEAKDFSTEQSMIRMQWKMLTPVGGIRVMSNAELRVQPVHVQLDYDTATMLFNYLFPKDDKGESSNGSQNGQHKKHGEMGSDPIYDSENDSGSSHSTSTSESSSNPFRKLMARRRANGRTDTSSNTSARSSVLKENSTFDSSSFTSSENNPNHDQRVPKSANHSIVRKKKSAQPSDEISIIMDRSSKYFVIGDFKVAKMILCTSFKAPKHLNIIDVHNLTLTTPSIHYNDKTWSSHEFASHLKRDLVKIVLAHSGKIIGNKFKLRSRKTTTVPLKQISDYSSYMTLKDLQEDGRPRDYRKLQNARLLSSTKFPTREVRLPIRGDNVDLSEVYNAPPGEDSEEEVETKG